jgi:hypothetical protein
VAEEDVPLVRMLLHAPPMPEGEGAWRTRSTTTTDSYALHLPDLWHAVRATASPALLHLLTARMEVDAERLVAERESIRAFGERATARGEEEAGVPTTPRRRAVPIPLALCFDGAGKGKEC